MDSTTSNTGDFDSVEAMKAYLEKYKVAESKSVCPSCGYCPHCGRGGYHTYPYYPQPYWAPVYPWQGSTWVTCDSTSGGVFYK